MIKGANKRQIAGRISFGNESIYTANIGKNGGHRLEKWIGNVKNYKDRFECRDKRDGEEVSFKTRKELYGYFEQKYSDEIEFFKYKEWV